MSARRPPGRSFQVLRGKSETMSISTVPAPSRITLSRLFGSVSFGWSDSFSGFHSDEPPSRRPLASVEPSEPTSSTVTRGDPAAMRRSAEKS